MFDRLEAGVPYDYNYRNSFSKCMHCGESPRKFPNEPSRREFQEITGICACCWEIQMLEPDDASGEDIEHAKKVLHFYGRKLCMQEKLPHAWQCLKCDEYIQGEQLLKPHICETEKVCKKCMRACTTTCSRCKLVYYCSEDCQKEDWRRHKREDCLRE